MTRLLSSRSGKACSREHCRRRKQRQCVGHPTILAVIYSGALGGQPVTRLRARDRAFLYLDTLAPKGLISNGGKPLVAGHQRRNQLAS